MNIRKKRKHTATHWNSLGWSTLLGSTTSICHRAICPLLIYLAFQFAFSVYNSIAPCSRYFLITACDELSCAICLFCFAFSLLCRMTFGLRMRLRMEHIVPIIIFTILDISYGFFLSLSPSLSVSLALTHTCPHTYLKPKLNFFDFLKPVSGSRLAFLTLGTTYLHWDLLRNLLMFFSYGK